MTCCLQVIVLLVGTNNHEHTAEQVTEGILEIVKTIRSKQEQAQVVVMVSRSGLDGGCRIYGLSEWKEC